MPSPTVSVIVASYNSGGLIKDCLLALERQTMRDGFEVIVVDSSNDGSRELLREQFPYVKQLDIPYPGSRALMRAQGILHAQGDIVAITEDHCVPKDDWLERIILNHRSPALGVGGVVENSARDRAAYWAIYFCEYYKFMPPLPAGPAADVPGSNASYKRKALDQTSYAKIGMWDNLITAEVGGGRESALLCDPTQVIYHDKREEPLRFLFHRYNYSRCFAGLRSKGISSARRLFYLTFSPTLPALVLWRTFREVWKKGRNRGKLVQSLPFLVPFLIASGTGEFVGYLAGVGESWRKIE